MLLFDTEYKQIDFLKISSLLCKWNGFLTLPYYCMFAIIIWERVQKRERDNSWAKQLKATLSQYIERKGMFTACTWDGKRNTIISETFYRNNLCWEESVLRSHPCHTSHLIWTSDHKVLLLWNNWRLPPALRPTCWLHCGSLDLPYAQDFTGCSL